jgi:hypothetical protein
MVNKIGLHLHSRIVASWGPPIRVLRGKDLEVKNEPTVLYFESRGTA